MRFRITLTLLLACLSFGVLAEKPQRIVSLNLCTDQLLLMMVERERIASISKLGADPRHSFMIDYVGDLPVNHALAEEIIHYQPDLVLAGDYTAPHLLNMLRRQGYRVETFPVADDLFPGVEECRILGDYLPGRPVERGSGALRIGGH